MLLSLLGWIVLGLGIEFDPAKVYKAKCYIRGMYRWVQRLAGVEAARRGVRSDAQ